MMTRKRNLLAGLAVVALCMAFVPEVSAQQVRLESRFTNAGVDPLASGHARYDARGGDRHLRVSVEDVYSTDMVFVYAVDPTFTEFIYIGEIWIDPILGFGGEIDLNTTDGADVPVLGQDYFIFVHDINDPWPLLLYGDLQPRP